MSFTRSDSRYGCGASSAAASSMETTLSSAPTGFRRFRPCRDESGRNVAPRLTQPTQVESVPLLADTPVDTQVNESSPIGFAADAVPETILASSGAVRRLVSVHRCQQKFLQCMVGASRWCRNPLAFHSPCKKWLWKTLMWSLWQWSASRT